MWLPKILYLKLYNIINLHYRARQDIYIYKNFIEDDARFVIY